jgi:hypothetical protein
MLLNFDRDFEGSLRNPVSLSVSIAAAIKFALLQTETDTFYMHDKKARNLKLPHFLSIALQLLISEAEESVHIL